MVGVAAFVVCALTLRRRTTAERVSPFLALAQPKVGAHGFEWFVHLRTHFYTAPAAGLLVAMAAVWLDTRVGAKRWVAIGLATLIVGTGLASGSRASSR